MAFYCNGKKGICDLDDCPDDCMFFDGHGGYEIEEENPMTNSDRIRAMNDEELAALLFGVGYDGYDCAKRPYKKPYYPDSKEGWIKWLGLPTKKGEI